VGFRVLLGMIFYHPFFTFLRRGYSMYYAIMLKNKANGSTGYHSVWINGLKKKASNYVEKLNKRYNRDLEYSLVSVTPIKEYVTLDGNVQVKFTDSIGFLELQNGMVRSGY
jgi:hypothetical protein